VYSEQLKKLKEVAKPGAAPAAAAATPDPKAAVKKNRMWILFIFEIFLWMLIQRALVGNVYPIIMISSSPTALITMHNVRKFLGDALYAPSPLNPLSHSEPYFE
jgi:hypothetical protein